MSIPPLLPSPLPGWRIALGAVARGAGIWLLVRALVGVVPGSLWPTFVILGVTTIVALAEVHAQRLPTFLANLGVPVRLVVAFWLLPVVLFELYLLASGVEYGGMLVLLANA